MTRRILALTLVTLALSAGLALADPTLRVTYEAGITRLQIEGSYPQSTYSVWRSDAGARSFDRITASEVLCLGECYATDPDAAAGGTYQYRFDLTRPDGSRVSFGPYAVTIGGAALGPMRAFAAPNPGGGATKVSVFFAGRATEPPVDAELTLLDLHGRAVRTLFRGPVARGTTAIAWDGRDAAGRSLEAGIYFLRLQSRLGTAVSRIARIR